MLPGVTAGYVERPRDGHRHYQTLDEYIKQDDIMVIYAKDIKDAERIGKIPAQGYVWID
jgi:hypothetical protein